MISGDTMRRIMSDLIRRWWLRPDTTTRALKFIILKVEKLATNKYWQSTMRHTAMMN